MAGKNRDADASWIYFYCLLLCKYKLPTRNAAANIESSFFSLSTATSITGSGDIILSSTTEEPPPTEQRVSPVTVSFWCYVYVKKMTDHRRPSFPYIALFYYGQNTWSFIWYCDAITFACSCVKPIKKVLLCKACLAILRFLLSYSLVHDLVPLSWPDSYTSMRVLLALLMFLALQTVPDSKNYKKQEYSSCVWLNFYCNSFDLSSIDPVILSAYKIALPSAFLAAMMATSCIFAVSAPQPCEVSLSGFFFT